MDQSYRIWLEKDNWHGINPKVIWRCKNDNMRKTGSAIISSFSFAYVRYFGKLFHKEGFTYDYVFDWNMLKSGGSGPESDEKLAKHQSQNQWQE